MIQSIKKKLIEQPDLIAELLEKFSFANIKVNEKYISFGREMGSNPSAICIYLTNNENIFVQDYARNNRAEIFSYIIKEKNIEFGLVFEAAKNITGISSWEYDSEEFEPFGGFYKRIKKNSEIEKEDIEIPITDLEIYPPIISKRFLDDHIYPDVQRRFDIRYDPETQRILIPIRSPSGKVVGLKGRLNSDPSENEAKYLYIVQCQKSKTLFGFSENYQYLHGNDIFVVESEKSVMQAYGYGFRNFVALSGNTISTRQCKLITELMPKSVSFLLDNNLDLSISMSNARKLKKISKLFQIEIKYWDWKNNINIPEKCSPTDLEKSDLINIMENELVVIA